MLSGFFESVVVGVGTGAGRLAKELTQTVYNETTALARQGYDWVTAPASKTQPIDARLIRAANNSAIRKWCSNEFNKAQQKVEAPEETQRFKRLNREIEAKIVEIDATIKPLNTVFIWNPNKAKIEKLESLKLALNFLKSAKTLAALRMLTEVKKTILESDPLTKELITAIYEPVELEKTPTEKVIGKIHAIFKR